MKSSIWNTKTPQHVRVHTTCISNRLTLQRTHPELLAKFGPFGHDCRVVVSLRVGYFELWKPQRQFPIYIYHISKFQHNTHSGYIELVWKKFGLKEEEEEEEEVKETWHEISLTYLLGRLKNRTILDIPPSYPYQPVAMWIYWSKLSYVVLIQIFFTTNRPKLKRTPVSRKGT